MMSQTAIFDEADNVGLQSSNLVFEFLVELYVMNSMVFVCQFMGDNANQPHRCQVLPPVINQLLRFFEYGGVDIDDNPARGMLRFGS